MTKPDYRNSEIETVVVRKPFDVASEELSGDGYKLIPLSQNARLRREAGARNTISQNGNYVFNDVIYVPKSKPKLTIVHSPILRSATEATQAHRKNKEFYLTEEQLGQSLEGAIDFPEKNVEIPTNRFAEEKFTVEAFGSEEDARKYGEFLKEYGIKSMPVLAVDKNYVDQQANSFARKLWFRRLGVINRSILNGDNRNLDYGNRVRGVRSVSADEVSAQKNSPDSTKEKNSELYSPREITTALKKLKLTGLEEILFTELRK